jgi:hypothetical protein
MGNRRTSVCYRVIGLGRCGIPYRDFHYWCQSPVVACHLPLAIRTGYRSRANGELDVN